MIYAVTRKDLEVDGSEAIAMPAVTIKSTDLFIDHDCDLANHCECGCRTIPGSAYPIRVLHQDDDGLVYLLLGDEVVVGQSIDFDYKNIPTKKEESRGGSTVNNDTATQAWAKGFAAGSNHRRKCPRIESSKYLCDRPAEYEIHGVVVCEIHARRMMDEKQI